MVAWPLLSGAKDAVLPDGLFYLILKKPYWLAPLAGSGETGGRLGGGMISTISWGCLSVIGSYVAHGELPFEGCGTSMYVIFSWFATGPRNTKVVFLGYDIVDIVIPLRSLLTDMTLAQHTSIILHPYFSYL